MIRSVVDSFSFGSLVDIFSQFGQDLLASKWGVQTKDRQVASYSVRSEKFSCNALT